MTGVRTFCGKAGTSSWMLIDVPFNALLVLRPLGKNRPRPLLAPFVKICITCAQMRSWFENGLPHASVLKRDLPQLGALQL